MSQRRWLATAVIFRPSDMSLGLTQVIQQKVSQSPPLHTFHCQK